MKKINSHIFKLIVFLAANTTADYTAQAKITITSPKAESWLLPMDDDRTIEITGNTSNLPSGTELKLSIDRQRTKATPQTWKTKLSKSGSFTFEIDQYLIYPNQKTTLTVEAIKDGVTVETQKQDIFCCSAEGYGFYKELTLGAEQAISVSQPGTDIDGIRLTIPKKAMMENKKPRVIITVQIQERDIPLDKYIPLNSQIDFYFSDFTSTFGIKYSLRAQPNIPRDTLSIKSSSSDWTSSTGRPWEKIDLKKSKIIILAHDQNDQVWKEIIPSKIVGNDVEFILPDKHVFNRFLPAAKVLNKK